MISFCVATNTGWCERQTYELLDKLISSIERECHEYEVLICGNIKLERSCVRNLYVENMKLGAKNNYLFQESKYPVICYIRDYMELVPGWKEGWDRFGYSHWDLGMNTVLNKDCSRFRDWCQWENEDNGPDWYQYEWGQQVYRKGSPYLADYSDTRTNTMYISGGYFLGQKDFLLQYPFDNNLDFAHAEDVKWYDSFRNKDFSYKMNTDSTVRLNIQKDTILKEKC